LNPYFQCMDGYNSETGAGGLPVEPDLALLKELHLDTRLLEVRIELLPGRKDKERNIVMGATSPVSVALLGSAGIDVRVIDAATLSFAGAKARKSASTDVNRDGHPDLVAEFSASELALSPKSLHALLRGSFMTGQPLQGETPVHVIDRRSSDAARQRP